MCNFVADRCEYNRIWQIITSSRPAPESVAAAWLRYVTYVDVCVCVIAMRCDCLLLNKAYCC